MTLYDILLFVFLFFTAFCFFLFAFYLAWGPNRGTKSGSLAIAEEESPIENGRQDYTEEGDQQPVP